MLNLIFAVGLIAVILWVAKKFYFPVRMASHPERYPAPAEASLSKKDCGIILFNLQRWRREGKITREEYDHLIDLCLSEMREPPVKD